MWSVVLQEFFTNSIIIQNILDRFLKKRKAIFISSSCNVNTALLGLLGFFFVCVYIVHIPGKTTHTILIIIVMEISVYSPQKGIIFFFNLLYYEFPRYEHTCPNSFFFSTGEIKIYKRSLEIWIALLKGRCHSIDLDQFA